MPAGAPKGNKYGVGNKGGAAYGFDRVKIRRIRDLVHDEIIECFEKGNAREKREMAKLLLPYSFPRADKEGGDGEGENYVFRIVREEKAMQEQQYEKNEEVTPPVQETPPICE